MPAYMYRPTQYKYRFSKVWKWKKNIPDNVKNQALMTAVQRAAQGKATSIEYKGKLIDPRRVQRQILKSAKKESFSLSQLFQVPEQQIHVLGSYVPFSANL